MIEERKRSNTDTIKINNSEFDPQKELNFSITPGPASFSTIDDIFKAEDTSKSVHFDEMVYGNVQFFPSSSPQPTTVPTQEQYYINAPTQFKPAYENVKGTTLIPTKSVLIHCFI